MAAARLMLFPGAFPAVSRRMAGFCRLCSSIQECTESISSETEKHILCSKTAQDVVKSGKLLVRDEFVSKEEEEELVKEVELSFRRMKYEYDHWDGVIKGYRETEKSHWRSQINQSVILRLQRATLQLDNDSNTISDNSIDRHLLPHVHVLDLAKDGYIGPHIDSVKFCGNTIAGISLLSDSVMKLVHKEKENDWIVMLLPQRSLYIMSDQARYDYKHEILPNSSSYYNNIHIPRHRRVSVIARMQP